MTAKYIYNHIADLIDSRDLLFERMHWSSPLIPKAFDLRSTKFVPPILDQKTLGACGPNEISNALRYCLEKEHGVIIQPSRLFIYYFTRLVDGNPVSQDTGVSIRGMFTAIQKYGACDEKLDPYNISEFSHQPSKEAIAGAKKHISGFQYMSVKQDLDHIKQAIMISPVVFGINVYESLEADKTISSGDIPMPDVKKEKCLGGHCVALYGWNDANKKFLMMNSWGSDVGQHGWFEIPYEYVLDKNLSNSLWIAKFFK